MSVTALPDAPATTRNREPILAVLRKAFASACTASRSRMPRAGSSARSAASKAALLGEVNSPPMLKGP